MTKHTAIIILAIIVIITAIGGFPSPFRTAILALSGLGISVLAYLSSVVYCSNCRKLIDEAEESFNQTQVVSSNQTFNPPKVQ